MKRILILAVFGLFVVIAAAALTFQRIAEAQTVQTKMPEVIILGKDAKLGQVTFNHVSHNGGKYSIAGTGPIACI